MRTSRMRRPCANRCRIRNSWRLRTRGSLLRRCTGRRFLARRWWWLTFAPFVSFVAGCTCGRSGSVFPNNCAFAPAAGARRSHPAPRIRRDAQNAPDSPEFRPVRRSDGAGMEIHGWEEAALRARKKRHTEKTRNAQKLRAGKTDTMAPPDSAGRG